MSQQCYGFIVDDVGSKHLCGLARVVFQEPPEPFTTLHWAFTLCLLADRREEQDIALALMIPLVMKMCHILNWLRVLQIELTYCSIERYLINEIQSTSSKRGH